MITKARMPSDDHADAGRYVAVMALSDLPPGTSATVSVGGDVIALFNVAGTVHAIDNFCLYDGAPLAAGALDGTIVTPCRGRLRYDIATGQVMGVPELRIDVFDATIENGVVWVAARRPWRSVE
jgi:3-phenylpropionate/trans-cinnamate dioxygenase ferredoxin subunit